jgi:hypothetical protein
MAFVDPPATPVFYAGVDAVTELNVMASAFNFLLNRPVFRARRVASWTITEGTHQFAPWDTIDEDGHSGWGPSQTPAQAATRYVAQAAGWYMVCAQVSLSGTGAADLILIPAVAVNGSSPTGQGVAGAEGTELFVPTGTGAKSSIAVEEVYANQGDYIEIDLYYSTESAITAADTTAGWQPRVDIVWMGV